MSSSTIERGELLQLPQQVAQQQQTSDLKLRMGRAVQLCMHPSERATSSCKVQLIQQWQH